MDHRLVGLVVGALLLAGLAGCTAVPESVPTGTDGDRTHPFAGETVTVSVDGTDRERTLVAEALDYWAANASQYAGFSVDFRVLDARTPADGTDVQVLFRETVECGDSDYSAGCAPRLNASTGLDRPAPVRIQRGLADDATRLVVRHEAGHLLGLSHDDRPRAVMAHERELATQPRPNASERAMPWNDSTLTVALDADGETRERYRGELDYALDYVREGADGAVPADVSVRVVEDPEAADVTVRPVSSDDCTADEGSCLVLEGVDPDQDGAIERYTRAEIRLVGLDPDAASWHVASQFVGTFHTGDSPDRLDEADARERRGDWHE